LLRHPVKLLPAAARSALVAVSSERVVLLVRLLSALAVLPALPDVSLVRSLSDAGVEVLVLAVSEVAVGDGAVGVELAVLSRAQPPRYRQPHNAILVRIEFFIVPPLSKIYSKSETRTAIPCFLSNRGEPYWPLPPKY
jgi:hypothetical protein